MMIHAYVFPGQGSQYPGMGREHYEQNAFAKRIFDQANEVLGFRISEVMFHGTAEDLRQTAVTQPAIFLHSVIAFKAIENPTPHMVAGHSLGEFSALAVNSTLSFEDALKLVSVRARAMQKACEGVPSTMAAILGLEDERVAEVCAAVQTESGEVVVPANYNSPGQVVISGSVEGVAAACERLKAAGAKRAVELQVGGAFHSPLMEPARAELAAAIESVGFHRGVCPVYQNVVGRAVTEPDEIRHNLVAQLTGPVLWTQSVRAMVADGAEIFTEVGPGKVLQGLIGKIHKGAVVEGVS